MRAAVALLVILLAVHVPPSVCMPPDIDVVQWDVCTRGVFRGGALYRDVLENNLPGMLWWQGLVRATLGWRSEAIRVADLLIVAACAVLLTRWLPADAPRAARVLVPACLAGFYLGTSEWCHAQRDVWMLLPVLIALRRRSRLVEGAAGSFAGSAAEGVLWGLAVWIKPVALVLALACWAASLRGLNRRAADLGGLLVGGVAAGAGGLVWLAWTGAWADFWDVMLVWNREYAAFDYTGGQRLAVYGAIVARFFPWPFAHLVAVPIASGWLRAGGGRGLLAALYLAWLGSAVLIQHPFDYVHAPPLLLATALIAIDAAADPPRRLALAAFLAACMLLRLGPLTGPRLAVWGRCWTEGSTPALRDRLGLLNRVRWEALEGVRGELRRRGVADGELSVLSMHGLSLFLDPGIRPATRYLAVQNCVIAFRRQRGRVLDDLAASRQRFLFVDADSTLWKGDVTPPADDRVVYTSGPYRLYALSGPDMRGWVVEHLDLR
ncbi:MAG: hypothetical protein ACRC33_27670 [Gemmataceae bacterium]